LIFDIDAESSRQHKRYGFGKKFADNKYDIIIVMYKLISVASAISVIRTTPYGYCDFHV